MAAIRLEPVEGLGMRPAASSLSPTREAAQAALAPVSNPSVRRFRRVSQSDIDSTQFSHSDDLERIRRAEVANPA